MDELGKFADVNGIFQSSAPGVFYQANNEKYVININPNQFSLEIESLPPDVTDTNPRTLSLAEQVVGALAHHQLPFIPA
ncbi:hypothetical protein [Nguyenibacter vanlangensis]|uniref:Uncharacterized protein n=1 Tax=Nguyenibacter vanlangensis TaxID=1216886 RepID=A0A7Y7IWG6_9PROT|nr:hypothetical protein [Nguyenibacter vanlangensis]NVN11457.1 hypothetical protein [Nguyenibacter vanlangensis]